MVASENSPIVPLIAKPQPSKAKAIANKRYLDSLHRKAVSPPPLSPFHVYKEFDYPKEYNSTLKAKIRERDNHSCRYCGETDHLHTHHINYDKRDCQDLNLITLCEKCHYSVSFERNVWYRYFWKLLNLP